MQVIVNLPDRFFLDASTKDIVGRLKLYTALVMFQTGQLSAGSACEFADVDRYVFLAACKQHNIAVIDYNEADLEADFEEMKRERPDVDNR